MTIRKSFLLGLMVALLAHAVLIVVALLVFQPFTFTEAKAPATATPPIAQAAPVLPDDLPITVPELGDEDGENITDEQLRDAIASIQQQAEDLTDPEREALLNKMLPLAKKMDPERLQRHINRVESIFPSNPDRAYAPRENVAGPVHYESILPYHTEKVTQSDGTTLYRQTWVDKDGRTVVMDVKQDQATLADRLLYQSGQDETLGKLMQAALRISDQISQAQMQSAQPSSR